MKASTEGKIKASYEENVRMLENELGVGVSFDVKARPLEFAGKRMHLFFVDGLIKDMVFLDITRTLAEATRADLVPSTLKKLFKTYMSYISTSTESEFSKLVDGVLAGRVVVLVEGEAEAIMIEARNYPARGPEEPDLEKVVRGSRDGFTETIIFNTALIRRRLRDPKFRTEIISVGTRSKSDICVAYIADIANPDLVNEIKQRIKNIAIDGLPMAEKSLEELVSKDSAWNPFPAVRYTERPDVAATHLLEGHILIMVDTSPSVMIAPTTLFHHVQHAEEYRQQPIVGAYIRWIRFFAIIFGSLLAVPLWMAVSMNEGLLPEALKFIGPDKIGKVPLVAQFLIAEVGVDLVRMAAIHTPSPLATALGLIAAFMIGDVAINVGLFTPEVILYMAIAAVGTFATPSYELGMALRLWRLLLIVLVAAFGIWGLVGGLAALFVFLLRTKSFGLPYLWPLIPFNWPALKTIILRYPVPLQNIRPSFVSPIDNTRQPLGHRAVSVARKPELTKSARNSNRSRKK